MRSTDRGYAMAALLVALSVMSIMLGVALPVWNAAARREREAELIFRGEQYARAVELFQRRNPGVFPPNLDLLVDGKFLRKKYTDPMTGGEFQLLYAGQLQAGQVGLGGQ
ncbi:MAG: type II secretion system protein, partial [Acidobacteria bacterium]|nr:type II secretion system protein [Acidobacteriota bacterium]